MWKRSNKKTLWVSLLFRPDCLPKGTLKFFEELAAQTYLSIEFALNLDDQQLILRRGHDKEASIDALKQLRKIPNLNVCAPYLRNSR